MVSISKEQIQAAIYQHGLSKAAESLGIGYSKFLNLRRKFGLPIVLGTNKDNQRKVRWSRVRPFDIIANSYYRAYRSSAARRGHSFEISIADFKELVGKECRYCGQIDCRIMHTPRKGYRAKLNGLDRRDNRIGYTKENCVPCCRNCNYAKRSMTEMEFISWIKAIYQHSVGLILST